MKGEEYWMKKRLSILLAILMMTVFATGCGAQPQSGSETNATTILLQIGNPTMTVDGNQQEIDPGRGTVPVIAEGRTLLPVRPVVEAMGGSVAWEEDTQTAVFAKGDVVILLTIGSHTAFRNEERHELDAAPVILGDRTMLPIRFVAESFGYDVDWNGETQMITLTLNGLKTEDDDRMGLVADTNQVDKPKNNSIVVYFSQTGTTRPFALNIAEITHSDIYELVPAVPYTKEDIDYGNQNSRANREQEDDAARPAIAGEKIDLSPYDTVYLGYPIWWGTFPRIINTFMDTYDLSGKTILPFCTSGSTGIASSVSAIRQYCPNAVVKDGFRIAGQTSETEINRWLSESTH